MRRPWFWTIAALLLACIITLLPWLDRQFWTLGNIQIEAVSRDEVLLDCFVATYAKGASGPIAQDFSLTCEADIRCDQDFSPAPAASSLGLTASVTAFIPAGDILTGPEETAAENSREYRVRILGHTGTWSATATHRLTGRQIPLSGAWSAPQSWEDYHIDRIILPQ